MSVSNSSNIRSFEAKADAFEGVSNASDDEGSIAAIPNAKTITVFFIELARTKNKLFDACRYYTFDRDIRKETFCLVLPQTGDRCASCCGLNETQRLMTHVQKTASPE